MSRVLALAAMFAIILAGCGSTARLSAVQTLDRFDWQLSHANYWNACSYTATAAPLQCAYGIQGFVQQLGQFFGHVPSFAATAQVEQWRQAYHGRTVERARVVTRGGWVAYLSRVRGRWLVESLVPAKGSA